MKTNRFIIAALSFAAAAVSCQKEDFGGVENVRQTESATIVTGEMTRTSLSGKEIHWTGDDVIAVFDNANYKNVFNISEAEGSYASFDGSVTSGTTQIYAVYPADLAVSANGSDLKVNIPTNQTSKVGSFAEEHNISVAKGAKVPGVEAIENITFKNVCALLKFTIPSYVENVKSVNFSTSSPISGEATVDFSGDAPVLSVGPNGSTSVTMTGSYPAGSEFLFVLAPGEIKGCTVTVTDNEGQTWKIVVTSTFTLEAGKYKNLGRLDVEPVAATASATHVKSGETLVGTDVTLKLNIPAVTQKHVTAVSIEIKNSAGQVVRSSSNTALTQKLSATQDWPYLPQGTYTVSGTYTLVDGKVKAIAPTSFTSPAPTFAVTSYAYTSYTKYQTSGASAANAVTGDAICDITSATVAISDAILNNSKYASLKGGFSYALDGNATTSAKVTNQSWGKHTVTATYTFDGAACSGSTDCHVTGLPYTANPPTNSGNYAWGSNFQTTLNTINWESSEVHLEGISRKALITSPTFHVPANIGVKLIVSTQMRTMSVLHVYAQSHLICRVSGNEVINRYGTKGEKDWKGSSNNIENFTGTGTGTLTSSNSVIEVENEYNKTEAYIKVKSVTLQYN